MKSISNQSILKTIYFAFSFITAIPLLAQVPEFDNDKPAATYNNQFSQTYNTIWDGPKFYSQWPIYDDPEQTRIYTKSGNWTNRAFGYLSEGHLRRKTKLMHWNTFKMDKIIQTLGKMNYLYLVRSGVVNARA